MSEANVKTVLSDTAGYGPSILERVFFGAKVECERVGQDTYKHTFTLPSQPIAPTEYGMKHFIPALYVQSVAKAIAQDLREAFPPHMWQSYFAHKRAVHRAKLRRRRKIQARERRRRQGRA